jgi:ectoine hydroxylase-related dioxygenase (phytanoyl-CoA dioxygenase family)
VAEREVRTFALLATHLPGGGGTLVVAGSHRLVTALAEHIALPSRSTATAVAKKALASDPWFKELFDSDHQPGRLDRLMNDGAVVNGIPVRVVELTGGPGDVFVMHPWTLHAVSPNRRGTPRLMLMTSLFDAAHPLLVDHGAGEVHPDRTG